jgi:ATP/ADP translocase
MYIYVHNIIKANLVKKKEKKKKKKKKRITGFFYSLKYLNKNREKKRIS